MVTILASDKLDSMFAALADPTRRAIVARLADGGATVGQLARPFRVSRPAISKHLRVLEAAAWCGGFERDARAGVRWSPRGCAKPPNGSAAAGRAGRANSIGSPIAWPAHN